ncbi:MAG: acyl-CoA dehydrogenase [Burkholderiaceae bacterium]|nr:acyl-CoA dehydrogenase [Burkholderiaceae bacterium]
MDFNLTPEFIALRDKTRDFITQKVIPFEGDARETAHGPTPELRQELIALAKAAGLLTPHASIKHGGLGLSHVAKAIVFEEAGYSRLGPIAMNIHAPDEGNIHLMEQVASPAQQVRWLIPQVQGKLRSCFAMTEPAPGAGSDFTNLRIPADQILGELGKGFRYAQVRLAPARLTHCMRWLGQARRAHDIALAYAQKRQAFGQRLGDHEGVGFMLADNDMDLQTARLHILHTAWLLDQGQKCNYESSRAKVVCSEAQWRVVDRCVQIMGGQGVTGESAVMRIFTDMRAFRIYDGPSEVHRWSMARKLLDQTR